MHHAAHPDPPLASRLAAALRRDAESLGAHWQQRSRTAAPRFADGAPAAAAQGTQSAKAVEVVRAMAEALGMEPGYQESAMLAGWDYGAGAHAAGLSLHSLLKELNLLLAILLYALESAAAEPAASVNDGDSSLLVPDSAVVPDSVVPASNGAPPSNAAADALRVARRLHQRMSLLGLAASKGYTHAYVGARRGQYRVLRHDMRNPVGTIQSAVALMQDETLSEAQRHDARYPAMVARNAQTLAGMITSHLADDRVLDRELAVQPVSITDLAISVRRATRDDARAAQCEVVVDASLPDVRTDAVGLELAMRAMISLALRAAPPGARIHLGGSGATASPDVPGSVCVTVRCDPAVSFDDAPSLPSVRAIAERAGALVTSSAELVQLEIPASAVHSRDDVAGAGERANG